MTLLSSCGITPASDAVELAQKFLSTLDSGTLRTTTVDWDGELPTTIDYEDDKTT